MIHRWSAGKWNQKLTRLRLSNFHFELNNGWRKKAVAKLFFLTSGVSREQLKHGRPMNAFPLHGLAIRCNLIAIEAHFHFHWAFLRHPTAATLSLMAFSVSICSIESITRAYFESIWHTRRDLFKAWRQEWWEILSSHDWLVVITFHDSLCPLWVGLSREWEEKLLIKYFFDLWLLTFQFTKCERKKFVSKSFCSAKMHRRWSIMLRKSQNWDEIWWVWTFFGTGFEPELCQIQSFSNAIFIRHFRAEKFVDLGSLTFIIVLIEKEKKWLKLKIFSRSSKKISLP